MATTRAISVQSLARSQEETNEQLRELVKQVTELARLQSVSQANHDALAQRVNTIEENMTDRRRGAEARTSSQRNSIEVAILSGFISLLIGLVVFAVSHVSWR
jgi:Tfp pilus assembly protein FimV